MAVSLYKCGGAGVPCRPCGGEDTHCVYAHGVTVSKGGYPANAYQDDDLGLMQENLVMLSTQKLFIFTRNPAAATPTASVAGGTTIPGSTGVTLATASVGATIRYTTNNTPVLSTSPIYTAPLFFAPPVSLGVMIRARAFGPSLGTSAELMRSFTVAATVATPVLGARLQFIGSTTVTITSITPAAVIHFSTDGSDPTALSAVYTAPFTLTTTTTIKAIAIKPGLYNSAIKTAAYTAVISPSAPTPSQPDAYVFVTPFALELETQVVSAQIHYTTDGSVPTSASPVYTTALALTASTTVKAIAVVAGAPGGPLLSVGMVLADAVAAPVLVPGAGAVDISTRVVITSATPGAVITYTTDGSTPTQDSPVYTVPIPVQSSAGGTVVLNARAFAAAYNASAVATATLAVSPGTLRPVFVPGAVGFTPRVGPFFSYYTAGVGYLALTHPTAGAVMYWTSDGSTPTPASKLYSPLLGCRFDASDSTTLYPIKAIAVVAGVSSSVAVADYTVLPALDAIDHTAYPTLITSVPGPGAFSADTGVVLSTLLVFGRVFYTTTGAAPSISDVAINSGATREYTGTPIPISSTTHIRVAVAPNHPYMPAYIPGWSGFFGEQVGSLPSSAALWPATFGYPAPTLTVVPGPGNSGGDADGNDATTVTEISGLRVRLRHPGKTAVINYEFVGYQIQANIHIYQGVFPEAGPAPAVVITDIDSNSARNVDVNFATPFRVSAQGNKSTSINLYFKGRSTLTGLAVYVTQPIDLDHNSNCDFRTRIYACPPAVTKYPVTTPRCLPRAVTGRPANVYNPTAGFTANGDGPLVGPMSAKTWTATSALFDVPAGLIAENTFTVPVSPGATYLNAGVAVPLGSGSPPAFIYGPTSTFPFIAEVAWTRSGNMLTGVARITSVAGNWIGEACPGVRCNSPSSSTGVEVGPITNSLDPVHCDINILTTTRVRMLVTRGLSTFSGGSPGVFSYRYSYQVDSYTEHN